MHASLSKKKCCRSLTLFEGALNGFAGAKDLEGTVHISIRKPSVLKRLYKDKAVIKWAISKLDKNHSTSFTLRFTFVIISKFVTNMLRMIKTHNYYMGSDILGSSSTDKSKELISRLL